MAESKTSMLQRIVMGPDGTHGRITINGHHVCYTVELPWFGNDRDISCIPEGEYQLTYVDGTKFGRRLHVIDVFGRSGIIFHKGNWQDDTRGCILPATRIGRTSGGCCGYESADALQRLEAALPDGAPHVLRIYNCEPYRTTRNVRIKAGMTMRIDPDPTGHMLTFTQVDPTQE